MIDRDEHENCHEQPKIELCENECCEDLCPLCEWCPHDCDCTVFEKSTYDEIIKQRQTIKDMTTRIEKLEQRTLIDHRTIIRYKLVIDKLNEDNDLR